MYFNVDVLLEQPLGWTTDSKMREDLSRILDHLEVSATPQPILLGDLGFIIFTSTIATSFS